MNEFIFTVVFHLSRQILLDRILDLNRLLSIISYEELVLKENYLEHVHRLSI